MATITQPKTITLPKLHAIQQEIADHPARFKVVSCGRQFGKTRLASALAFKEALAGGRVWWVAPVYKIAKEGWSLLKHFALQLQDAMPDVYVNESEHIVKIPATGGEIEVRSADTPANLRGPRLDFLVIDEAAFVHPDAWAKVLRPTLAINKGRAIFISTPNGRNWFWEIYELGESGNDPEWKSWQRPSSANPFMPASEVEMARNELPEMIFQQEYEAAFLDDFGSPFRRVDAAATADYQDRARDGHVYICGVDWGKYKDFTVLIVIDVCCRSVCHMDRFNQIDYQVQLPRLLALHERFRFRSIIVERNSIGDPLIEQLIRERLPIKPFLTTGLTKNPAIEALMASFEKEQIKIIPEPVLIKELKAFTCERLPSGQLRYQAPPNLHDDCVMALAMANWDIAHGRTSPGIYV